jgi:glycosyltransferase involved in cell wall biosynthesis
MNKSESIMVSICMLTYKHENYIRQSIESILNQVTNYNIELIISNDCSPDNTDSIIKEIIKTHPRNNIIQYYRHEKNIGMHKNLDFILKKTKGVYIAFCEGDDYWTDRYKINKQITIFNQNPNVGLVHHDSNYLYEKSNKIVKDIHKKYKIKVSNGNVIHELLDHNNIFTLTVMFKSELLKYYFEIENSTNFLMADYPMWLSFSVHTNFHYIPESMATYRILENSASHFSNYKKEIEFLDSYINIKYFFIEKYGLKKYNIDEIENYYNFKKINIFSNQNKHKEIKLLSNKLKPQNLNQKLIVYFSKFPISLKIYYYLLNIYLNIRIK